MAATIIIYAGAIVVTFLFVIMLAQQSGLSDADDRSREPFLATLAGFVLLGALLFVLQRTTTTSRRRGANSIGCSIGLEQRRDDQDSRAAIDRASRRATGQTTICSCNSSELHRDSTAGQDLDEQRARRERCLVRIDPERRRRREDRKRGCDELHALGANARQRLSWLPPAANAPLSDLSGPPPTSSRARSPRRARLPRMPAENAAYLGRALFTDYLLPVELGGMLLLVATVGAIAIAGRRGRRSCDDRVAAASLPGRRRHPVRPGADRLPGAPQPDHHVPVRRR